MFFPQRPCPAVSFLGKKVCSDVGASVPFIGYGCPREVHGTSHAAVLLGLVQTVAFPHPAMDRAIHLGFIMHRAFCPVWKKNENKNNKNKK